jgi:hypothetical protein
MVYEMLSGINPFKVRNKNKFEKLQMILEDEIEMQPTFSETACSLIQGLLEKKVSSTTFIFNACYSQKRDLDIMARVKSRIMCSFLTLIGLHWRKNRLNHHSAHVSMVI